MSTAVQDRHRTDDAVEEIFKGRSIKHYQTSQLSYVRTAISLVSLGSTVDGFSLFLIRYGGVDVERWRLVEGLTLTSLFTGAVSIIWMLLR